MTAPERKHWPYCEHPECHSTETRGYAHRYPTSNGPLRPSGVSIMWGWGPDLPPGYERLCRSHSLLKWRVW